MTQNLLAALVCYANPSCFPILGVDCMLLKKRKINVFLHLASFAYVVEFSFVFIYCLTFVSCDSSDV